MAWMPSFFKKTPPKPRYGRSFDAAQSGRTLDITQTQSINSDLQGSLETLRGRCRQLAQNEPYVAQAFSLWKQNIIGSTGIDLHVQSRKNNGELDENPNTLIEDAWFDWLRYGNCTVDGTMSGVGMQQLVLETIARDGEALIVKRYGNQYGKYGFRLELVPNEQFNSQFTGTATNGNIIYQSIEFDMYLKPVAYWISSSAKTNQLAQLQGLTPMVPDIRIAAEDCYHIFEKHYIGQVRGFPWIVNAVIPLHHISMYKLTELENARMASLNQVYYTMPAGVDGITNEDIDQLGHITRELKPAGVNVLPQGADVKAVDWQSPNSNMPDFVRTQLKGVASGLGISYSALANDLENINFSSAKYAALADQTMYQNKQQWFIETFLDRLYRDWLKVQLDFRGHLALPMSKYDKYCKIKWTPRGFKSVNLVETARAALMLNTMGVLSLTQISSEMLGVDWEETVAQMARENKKLESLGIKLPSQVEILKLDLLETNEEAQQEGKPPSKKVNK